MTQTSEDCVLTTWCRDLRNSEESMSFALVHQRKDRCPFCTDASEEQIRELENQTQDCEMVAVGGQNETSYEHANN